MKLCKVEGCQRGHSAYGLCDAHAKRFKRGVDLNKPFRRANGTGFFTSEGYFAQLVDKKTKLSHVQIAENVLGKSLPRGAVIHHVDENKANNSNTNLVICPNQAYHNLIHQRMRALVVCGNANWRKCQYCKQYDDPVNISADKEGHVYHVLCRKLYNRNKHIKRKELL